MQTQEVMVKEKYSWLIHLVDIRDGSIRRGLDTASFKISIAGQQLLSILAGRGVGHLSLDYTANIVWVNYHNAMIKTVNVEYLQTSVAEPIKNRRLLF